MANANTKYARKRGYSDIKAMGRDTTKTRDGRNYGVRTGIKVNSSALRKASGKKPYGQSKRRISVEDI